MTSDVIPQRHPNAALYCDLMEYIKWRIDEVSKTIALINRQEHYLSNRAAAEFCLLQLRMVCELLAMGCIAVHIDVPKATKLHGEWNAHEIMKKLERLKPEYFPAAITETGHDTPDDPFEHHPKTGAISQKELLKSYHFFGGQLHTGTFSRYLLREAQSYDFSIIVAFVDKIVSLLNVHTYTLYGNKKLVRVIMRNQSDGRVWWNELELTDLSNVTPKGEAARPH